MKANLMKNIALVIGGFAAGILMARLPLANAAAVPVRDLTHRHFLVSLDEIRKNYVFGDEFQGRYAKSVPLSDGTTRRIELTPMLHDGMQVVELKDTGGRTYMGLNGTTTNGQLMIQVRDVDTERALLRQQGWPPFFR